MTHDQLISYLNGSNSDEPTKVSDFKFKLSDAVIPKITKENPDEALLPYYAEVVASLDTLGLLEDIKAYLTSWNTKLGS